MDKIIHPETFSDIPSAITSGVFKSAGVLGLLAVAALIIGFLLPGFNNLPYIIIFALLCVFFCIRGYFILKSITTNGYIIIKGIVSSVTPGKFDKKQRTVQFVIEDGDEISSNDKYLAFPYSGTANVVEDCPVTLYVSPLTSIENNNDFGRYINNYYAVQFTKASESSTDNNVTTIAEYVGSNSTEDD